MRYVFVIMLFIGIRFAPKAFHVYINEHERVYSFYPDSIPELAEILITGKKKKVYVREDTSFFRVNGFADGTEKTIADILKKIPGFNIDPGNGIISFQGRTVEKMKIDGADLFGNNYVVGSKNLLAGWIEEIQAIENDPDNPLMKHVTTNGKLIINLKTKKNMAVINSDINLGGGYRGDQHVAADHKIQKLGLLSRIKSFAVAGFNNIGINNGPINYLQYNDGNDPFQNASHNVPAMMNNAIFAPFIDPDRLWMNHQSLLNSNVIIQPGSRQQSIRINAHCSRDMLYNTDDQISRYSSAARSLLTSDLTTIRRRPVQLRGELEWKQFLTDDIWFSYRGFLQSEKQNVQIRQLINDSILVSGHNSSGSLLYIHEFDWTYRVAPQTIFRSSCTISSYYGNEQMEMQSDRKHSIYPGDYMQDIEVSKKVLRYEASLLMKKRATAIEFATGIRRSIVALHSDYYPAHDSPILSEALYHNQQNTKYTRAYQSVALTHRKGKCVIQADVHLRVHEISIRGHQKNNARSSSLKPDIQLSVTRKVSDEMKWIHHLNMRHQFLSDMPYFERAIRVSPRLIQINDVFPQIQRSLSYQSILVYQDLFRQQSAQVDFLYLLNDRSSAPYLEISDKITKNRALIVDMPQKLWHLNGRVEKFVAPFYSTISLEGSLSFSSYFNYVNAKQVRANHSLNRKAVIQIKTALPVLMNATYTFSMEEGVIQSGDENISGSFWWRQNLNLVWKCRKEWHGQIRADWYKLQRQPGHSLIFLDALISYRPLKKNYGFSLSGRNILNHHFFLQTRVIDYSTITNSISLLPQTILLEWDLRF
jgi:hypothetical protein